MKTFKSRELHRCSMCGEAVYDRSRLRSGEVKIVICWCGRSNLVSAPRNEKITDTSIESQPRPNP